MHTSTLLSAFLAAVTIFPGQALSATPEEWRSRSIYQVLTDRFARTDQSTTASCPFGFEGFCGGTYKGIMEKIDYIQGLGFDAIWISPITKQVSDPSRAYNGYTQTDLYDVNENFGSTDDLLALSELLHSKDMYLMVDVVTNHFGFDGLASLVDHSLFNPFDRAEYFNPICWSIDASIADMQKCWLGDINYPLPDVATTNTDVRAMYGNWIESLVQNYSVDGLRIDSVKNVEKTFFPGFETAAGVYAVGEVADPDVDFVCPYQGYLSGVLNYPGYYEIVNFFANTSATSHNLLNLRRYVKESCNDTTLLGTFTENHDQPRFANKTDDISLAKNALAYTFMTDGIPIVYAGQEQHYSGGESPYSREATWLSDYDTTAPLYTHIAALNQIRKLAIASSANYLTSVTSTIYTDDHNIAIIKGAVTGSDRGQVVTLTTNFGHEADSYTLYLDSTGWGEGDEITDVLSCVTSTVDDNGYLPATVVEGLPMVFYSTASLAGSGICDN